MGLSLEPAGQGSAPINLPYLKVAVQFLLLCTRRNLLRSDERFLGGMALDCQVHRMFLGESCIALIDQSFVDGEI